MQVEVLVFSAYTCAGYWHTTCSYLSHTAIPYGAISLLAQHLVPSAGYVLTSVLS